MNINSKIKAVLNRLRMRTLTGSVQWNPVNNDFQYRNFYIERNHLAWWKKYKLSYKGIVYTENQKLLKSLYDAAQRQWSEKVDDWNNKIVNEMIEVAGNYE